VEDLGAPEPGYWHAHRSDQAKQEETTQTNECLIQGLCGKLGVIKNIRAGNLITPGGQGQVLV
jgi:hypothetical protein